MATKNDKWTLKNNKSRFIIAILVIAAFAFGVAEAYFVHKNTTDRNTNVINELRQKLSSIRNESNQKINSVKNELIQKISFVRDEIYDQDRKQDLIIVDMLIKIARVETKILNLK